MTSLVIALRLTRSKLSVSKTKKLLSQGRQSIS